MAKEKKRLCVGDRERVMGEKDWQWHERTEYCYTMVTHREGGAMQEPKWKKKKKKFWMESMLQIIA